jgi:hypothetical protein
MARAAIIAEMAADAVRPLVGKKIEFSRRLGALPHHAAHRT